MEQSGQDRLHLIFDCGELFERVDNDCELLRDIIGIFKQEFPRLLQTLEDAVQAQDTKRVAIVAHTLKGMLSNLAASQAAATAARLEQLGRQGDSSELEKVFATFKGDTNELLLLLEACMAKECR
jgi:HPt (histidine-containing phosphotransfer) domain-containing protein